MCDLEEEDYLSNKSDLLIIKGSFGLILLLRVLLEINSEAFSSLTLLFPFYKQFPYKPFKIFSLWTQSLLPDYLATRAPPFCFLNLYYLSILLKSELSCVSFRS